MRWVQFDSVLLSLVLLPVVIIGKSMFFFKHQWSISDPTILTFLIVSYVYISSESRNDQRMELHF